MTSGSESLSRASVAQLLCLICAVALSAPIAASFGLPAGSEASGAHRQIESEDGDDSDDSSDDQQSARRGNEQGEGKGDGAGQTEENHGHGDNEGDDDHEHHHGHGGGDTIRVVATRVGRAVDDEPVRVEVIVREEIEEKAIMRPGNISMLVAETGGVRVQTTSPALGSANIRLQGLYGRYTQLLADGLPLYGGQTASIGLLQILPTDLSQVEVIKGAASSLYGSSAMGGVINLISRRPAARFEGEALANLTSRDGQDLTTYWAGPISDSLGASLTAGAHRQGAQDFDDDGWIDMAEYDRWSVRPRLFWTGNNGARLYATLGLMSEDRVGGTLPGQTVPDGNGFVHSQDTERFDGGLTAQGPVGGSMRWNVRGSAMLQDQDKRFGRVRQDDRQESYLIEASIAGDRPRSTWVAGLALQSERFDSKDFPAFDYRYDVPGLFAEVQRELGSEVSASLSARFEDHSEYGRQFSPRLSLLYRPGDWTVRASYGQGYFAPTPFVEDIEAAGLSRLSPLQGLQEETATTASLDVGYRFADLESNVTLFGSNVDGVTRLEPFALEAGDPLNRVRLINSPGESRIRGSEVLLRYYWRDFKLTASYLYLDATERDPLGGERRRIALTPKHSAGFVAMWEQHGRGRLGFEAYYTGTQRLDNNPYRGESDPYWHLGLLGEITLGALSWFVNAENLLNVRQTREDPLVLPLRTPSGRWTTDIWSRNDGFIINGGVRVRF